MRPSRDLEQTLTRPCNKDSQPSFPDLLSVKRLSVETMQDFSCLCGISANGMAVPAERQCLPTGLLHSPMGCVILVVSLNRGKQWDAAQDHSPRLCASLGTHSRMLTIILYQWYCQPFPTAADTDVTTGRLCPLRRFGRRGKARLMEQVDEERRNYLLKPKPLSKSCWLFHRRVPTISDKMLIKNAFFIYFCKSGCGIYLYIYLLILFSPPPQTDLFVWSFLLWIQGIPCFVYSVQIQMLYLRARL